MRDPDYIIDIQGLEGSRGRLSPKPTDQPAGINPQHSLRGRPWLSIYWKCCQTYSRVYRNRKGDAYEGRCPKCSAPVRALIGTDGTASRFFTAE